MTFFKLAILLVLFSLAVSSPAIAAKKTYLGFALETETEGFRDARIQRARVSRVQSGSPAQLGGLLVDDVIIEANGKLIVGAPAKDMMAILSSLKVGDHLRLKVDRADGTTAEIDIVAGER